MGNFHIANINKNDGIFVIADNTPNGGTATEVLSYDYPTEITELTNSPQIGAIVRDQSGNLHIADARNRRIYVIASDTEDDGRATELRSYLMPLAATSVHAMALDNDGNIHIFDQAGGNAEAFVIASNTANGARASSIRAYLLPNRPFYPSGAVTDKDGNIHLGARVSNIPTVVVIGPNTANNATATVLRTYTLSITGGRSIICLGKDSDDNIHIVKQGGQNVQVVADNVPNNTQATPIRSYAMPSSRTGVYGMTLVPDPSATLTISTTDTDIRPGEAVDFKITSDIDISDFTTADVTVTGGTRGALTRTDAKNYVLAVTAGSAGTLRIAIAADVVSPGNAASSQNFTINALPTVAISSTDTSIRAGEAFPVTFQWSEAVSGFVTGDVTVTGGTKGTFTAVDADTYTLVVTADSSAGDIVVTVAEDAVTLGNAETPHTFRSLALPTVDITFSVFTAEALEDFTVTFQWSESVSGFATEDVTISAGTKGAFTRVDGDTYRLVITPPASGSSAIAVTVAENAISEGNAQYAESINYATTRRTVAISTTESVIHENEVFDVDIVFSNPVTGFVAGDITVSGGTRGALTATDSENYVLRVTAGAAGTLTVAVGADVVVQGNTSASENFTVTVDTNVITIAPFSHQEIPLNTEFMLNVGITGEPEEVRVRGDLHGFRGVWNPTVRQVEVRGIADRIVYDAPFTIHADSVQRDGTFSVVPIAPVIVDPGRQTFYKDDYNLLEVELQNQVNEAKVIADWVGLTYNPGENMAVIEGNVPDENFSFDDGDIELNVLSPVGTDELMIPFDIADIQYDTILVTQNNGAINAITKTTGIASTGLVNNVRNYILTTPADVSITVVDTEVYKNEIYILGDDGICYVARKIGNRPSGGTLYIERMQIRRSFTIEDIMSTAQEGTVTGDPIRSPVSIAVDGTTLYILYSNSNLPRARIGQFAIANIIDGITIGESNLSQNDPTLNNAFKPDIITSDGTNFYGLQLVSSTTNRISRSGSPLTFLNYSRVPSSSNMKSSIAVDDTYLYYFQGNTERIYAYPKSAIAFNNSNTIISSPRATIDISNFSSPVSIAI